MTAAPAHDQLVMRLRDLVKEVLTAGTSRQEVLVALEDVRTRDPERQDVVLDSGHANLPVGGHGPPR